MKYALSDYELSRPLQVDKVSLGGVEEHIVASPLERAELAKRFNLQDLASLDAVLSVDRAEGHMFAVKGKLKASVVTTCVVTLEPMPLEINESIDVLFAPPHLIPKDDAVLELGDLEMPEPIENGVIDLGELTAQHLATALPLYPRKEGVVFEKLELEKPSAEVINPFAKLKNMVKNGGKSKS